MAFTNQTKKNTYTGDGATTSFAFTFPIIDEGDLLVQIKDNTTSVITTQIIATNYTVNGTGNRTGFTDYVSGNVVMVVAPTSTETLIIKRDLQATQETDYPENGRFPAASHERALDKLTMLHLQQQEDLSRAVKVDSAISTFDGTIPTPVASKFLAIDSAGTGLTLTDGTSEVLDFLDKTNNNFIVADGTDWVSETSTQARTSLGLGTANNPTFGSITSNGSITVSGTVDGRDVATDGTKLDGIEAGADVTDETNVVSALDGATITAVTVGTTDKVLIQDVDDSGNIKTVTSQSVADLAYSSGNFTSTITYDTNLTSPTFGSTTTVDGYYVRVGNMVTVSFDTITRSSTFSGTSVIIDTVTLPINSTKVTSGTPYSGVLLTGRVGASFVNSNIMPRLTLNGGTAGLYATQTDTGLGLYITLESSGSNVALTFSYEV